MKMLNTLFAAALLLAAGSANAERVNIVELTYEELAALYPTRVWRPVSHITPAIPDTYLGKYVQVVAVVTDVQLTETQMDTLETNIEGITGVHKAFVLLGSAGIPIDVVQDIETATGVGYDLQIRVSAQFGITPTPTP